MAFRLIYFFAALIVAPCTVASAAEQASGEAVDQAFMRSMQSMQQSMKPPTKGNADEDFVAMMIPHHEGAIAMAKVEFQYGKDPSLRRLAAKIVKDQNEEIGQMERWQKKRR